MHEEIKKIIDRLDLAPHPEGGYFREVYRSALSVDHPDVPADQKKTRCSGSQIYYLLGPGDFSAFHRVCWSDEIWHLYAGGPLELHMINGNGIHMQSTITADVHSGEPTVVVPAGFWQAARPLSLTGWALCGCTVAPGFEFSDFEMPQRAELISRFPQHAELIENLSRR